MTIGIYALYWAEQDLIYIGQSQNTESRLKEHLSKLRNSRHENYKVQNTYDLYGIPETHLVETCSICELNSLEIFYIKEFNSILKGLNINEGGSHGWGVHSGNSQLTKFQVLRVFSLLYKTTLPYSSISERTKVPIGNIANIKKGGKHSWLQEEYPIQYEKMLGRSKSPALIRVTNGHGMLVHSSGIYSGIINNINEFCRSQETLNSNVQTTRKCINEVLKGLRKEYRGWKLP